MGSVSKPKRELISFLKGVLEIPCQPDKIISRIDNGRDNRV